MGKIDPSTNIDVSETCSISGISKNATSTLGTISTNIVLPDNNKLLHKFHIVNDELPIPTDGLLGRDFLTNNKCIIDYDTWTLSCVVNNNLLEIPIEDNLDGSTMISPGCEVFKPIVINEADQDYVTISEEIAPGVFCANSIINKSNPIVKIVNTNNHIIKLKRIFRFKSSHWKTLIYTRLTKFPKIETQSYFQNLI